MVCVPVGSIIPSLIISPYRRKNHALSHTKQESFIGYHVSEMLLRILLTDVCQSPDEAAGPVTGPITMQFETMCLYYNHRNIGE